MSMSSLPPGTDLSMIPAQMPPPGVIPNFVNPHSNANLPRIFIYVTLPPMVVFLALRFYTRIKVSRKVGIDDYLCALAAAVIIAYCGVMLTFLDNPAGRHMWDIPVSSLTVDYASRSSILTGVYMIAAMLIKASILCLYWRLFQISMTASVMIWIGLFVDVVFYVVTFVLFMVNCIPRPEDEPYGGWLSLTFADRCNKISSPTTAATGIIGSVLDVYILIIPLIPVSGLRASWKKKAGIFAIFIAGSSACVFSIVGTAYRMMILKAPGDDITYTGMPIYAMNIGEINLGIMSATMPVAFVLFKGFSKTSLTWMSKLRYFTLGGRNRSQPTGASDVQMLRYEEVDGEKANKLPQVPKGTLTGLRSWMRNKNRTTPVPETTQRTAASDEMLTCVSAEYDYHRQLKAGLVVSKDASSVWTGTTGTAGGTPPHSSRGEGHGRSH